MLFAWCNYCCIIRKAGGKIPSIEKKCLFKFSIDHGSYSSNDGEQRYKQAYIQTWGVVCTLAAF